MRIFANLFNGDMYRLKKYVALWLVLVGMSGTMAVAQQQLSLNDCRKLALEANKSLKQAENKQVETEALKQAALWQMLPKVSANGGYLWMEKSVNLLSQEQKDNLNNLGSGVQDLLSQAVYQEMSGLPLLGNLIAQRLDNVIRNSNTRGSIDAIGQQLVSDLETNTENMAVGMVTITQPIYLGGKLMAAYRTAGLMDRLTGIEADSKREQVMIDVDNAYWQVVSVSHKKQLAEQYATLLRQLTANVEEMVAADVATQGDLAKVRVKLNEAEMTLTKATNGLALAKMLLAQRCGMPLDSQFEVTDTVSIDLEGVAVQVNMDSVWQHRSEMQKLRIADSIALQAVRIAASTLKPNVAISGGYLVSNPNVFDGFSNQWNGSFLAGVVVNVPILHPGGMYALKAAKARQREGQYRIEEAQEMITLQVNKVEHEMQLAYKKLAQAESNLTNAEENMKLADESFKAGMCGSSDLMAAQTAWMQAKSEVLDAKIEIKMNHLYLQQALGEYAQR
ncbi:MAG: TolC family protein [Bacteroidales bacterium]|nr:TolC family protein [Bacteroidales bacterium]